ncbi:Alternative NAD(P)H-ubiquinone oxidoreductase C1, chloroplastic/mitochondrial [Galdieria sulphuraria]|nr:Alternative NAD(P)H-ubiquinone oxidoreductase C1, chloroplastic/mitochondrial [Galdieria sulphuraria]
MLLAYVHGICSRKSSFNCFRRTHFLSSTRFLFPSKRRQVRAPSLHLSCLYTTREKSVNSSKPILHPKITILGGGFGGLYTALTLSRYPWTRLTKPKITLVDRSDRFVFLPMLYEVAFGQLDKWQVAPTFSQLLQGTDVEFVLGQVEKVDVQKSTYWLLPSVRNQVCHQFLVPTINLTKMRRQQNRKPVIFVIGGSYSGVELASNVAEYFRGEARVCIVDRGNRLLDAASEHNRNVALQTLRSLNVESLLDMEVSCVTENAVSLKSIQESTQESEKKFDADLVLWTAGFKPSSWLQFVALEKDPTGRILTSSTLQATRHDNIFVLGDAAAVTDVNGQRCKATAQVAIQQAECAAWNIWASLCNKKPVPFRYEHLGELMTLGKYNGTAEVFGIPLSGTSAQFTRRLAYLFRMPTNLHRLKVGQNWVFKPVSCFFENFSFPL